MKIETGQLLVIGCLIVTVGTSIFAFVTGVRNNFSSELLTSLYPIAGAALASIYFLIRLIFVEASNPIASNFTTAILQDSQSGMLFSMSNIWTGDIPKGMSPLVWIDVKGQDKSIVERLKIERGSSDNKSETKMDILELAIINWLQETNQQIGYKSHGFIEGFASGGSSGGLEKLDTKEVEIRSEGRQNPLLQNSKLLLPAGSRFIRKNSEEKAFRELEIVTSHSKFHLMFPSGWISEPLQSATSPVAKKVIRRLKLQVLESSLALNVFRVEVVISQNKETRFSFQAKREAEWLKRVAGELAQAFSWVDLKKRIENAPELSST